MLDKFTVQGIVALFIAISFVALVTLWMVHPPSGDQAVISLLNALIMVVGSAFLQVTGYFFGSSSGSKAKDDTQTKLVEKLALNNKSIDDQPEAQDELRKPGG